MKTTTDCPGENVIRHGLIWLCCDARRDTCSNVNIISDNGKNLEMHICQNPHPVEEEG
jgi:hypothetical protein